MKLRRNDDGSFGALEDEGTWYVLVVQRSESSAPFGTVVSQALGKPDDDHGLRRAARVHAQRGEFCVEIWQSVPGTWSEPDILLETWLRDGTCVVHSAPLPPMTAIG